MKKIILISLMLLSTTFCFANNDYVQRYVNMENSKDLVNPDGFLEYMIIKGDYLWFIADDFYNDPFKWTEIHDANPYIIDPDWIYPNNWLVIPNVYADGTGKPMVPVTKNTSQTNTWTEETDAWDETSKTWKGATQIDLDGDGIIDGVDLDGDGVIDAEAGIDMDGDGVIDGYDIDGDGNIDLLAGTTKTDEVEIAEEAAITALAATAATTSETYPDPSVTKDKMDPKCDETHKCDKCKHSYCGKPGWKLGIHAGYPVGGGPEDENLNLGLLLGTPLGIKAGPMNVGLGIGAFTYDFDNIYFGGGLLASLCVNDLLKFDIPLIIQLHGAGFYIFGEEQGLGIGGIGSASIPFGKSPLSLGFYGALGKYYPDENDYNWSNVGAVLFYTI